MSDAPLALLERHDDGVAVVRINRPEARNALNTATRKEIAAHFDALAEDESVRVIVLTGDETAFAAGADVKEFATAGPVDMMKRRNHRYFTAVQQVPQPVIAAINGFCLGGGLELAMNCDILVVGEGAQLGQPEVRVGIMPGAGGTQRLTRAVGKFVAMRMCLTGKPITGEEAFRFGLASDCVPDAEVFESALKMAKSLAKLPPLALQSVKESILSTEHTSLEAGLALERKSFQVLFASDDKAEGVQAFVDKRKPDFKGS